jgi:hypothetical protein
MLALAEIWQISKIYPGKPGKGQRMQPPFTSTMTLAVAEKPNNTQLLIKNPDGRQSKMSHTQTSRLDWQVAFS